MFFVRVFHFFGPFQQSFAGVHLSKQSLGFVEVNVNVEVEVRLFEEVDAWDLRKICDFLRDLNISDCEDNIWLKSWGFFFSLRLSWFCLCHRLRWGEFVESCLGRIARLC